METFNTGLLINVISFLISQDVKTYQKLCTNMFHNLDITNYLAKSVMELMLWKLEWRIIKSFQDIIDWYFDTINTVTDMIVNCFLI